MDLPIKIVIGGLGVRGYEVYASYAKRNPDKMQVTAIAEPNPIRRPGCAAGPGPFGQPVLRNHGIPPAAAPSGGCGCHRHPGPRPCAAGTSRPGKRVSPAARKAHLSPFAGMSGTAASGAPLRPDRHRGPCAALHSDFLHCETAAGIRRDWPAHPHGSDRKCGLLAFCPQLCAGQLGAARRIPAP